jgi:hypothetical protein
MYITAYLSKSTSPNLLRRLEFRPSAFGNVPSRTYSPHHLYSRKDDGEHGHESAAGRALYTSTAPSRLRVDVVPPSRQSSADTGPIELIQLERLVSIWFRYQLVPTVVASEYSPSRKKRSLALVSTPAPIGFMETIRYRTRNVSPDSLAKRARQRDLNESQVPREEDEYTIRNRPHEQRFQEMHSSVCAVLCTDEEQSATQPTQKSTVIFFYESLESKQGQSEFQWISWRFQVVERALAWRICQRSVSGSVPRQCTM